VFIPVKKIICITSSVLLTSGITSCWAAESPAASLVKNLVSTAGAELGLDTGAAEGKENTDSKNEEANQEVAAPLEGDNQGSEEQIEGQQQLVATQEEQQVAEGSQPIDTSVPPNDQAQQGTSEADIATQNEDLEQKHLVSQKGEVYSSPKIFPATLPDGWYFVTKDLATLKENVAIANAANHAPVEGEQQNLNGQGQLDNAGQIEDAQNGQGIVAVDDQGNQIAPMAADGQQLPINQDQGTADMQQADQQWIVSQTPQDAAARQNTAKKPHMNGPRNQGHNQQRGIQGVGNARGMGNVHGAGNVQGAPGVNTAVPVNNDGIPQIDKSKKPIMFQCYLA
jgi:hypothetical protein